MKTLKVTAFFVCIMFLISCGNKQSKEKVKEVENAVSFNISAYNVEVGKMASIQEFGEMLKAYDLDIACFSEAPGGNWTKEVGEILGMNYAVVGKYSTAGHVDKYKTIASKTPLYDYEEILMTDTLHTVTKAKTKIQGKEITIYSVHFPFGWRDQAHIDETTAKILSFVDYLKERQDKEISVVLGDFNFMPTKKDYTSQYYELFVNIGIDASWKDLGIDTANLRTWHAFDPDKNEGVIDHIMYNTKKAKALKGEIIELEKHLADHKPVWARLQLL